MSWAKIDDHFATHPKIIAAGGDAAWLHVCALCYCAEHLTDGLVPKALVGRLSDRKRPHALASRLVEVGMWLDDGEAYRLHDYLDWNPSREQVLREREAAKERRAKRGRTSDERRPNVINPVPVPVPKDLSLAQPEVEREPFEDEFVAWWTLYPRKQDRGQAFAAYQARRRAGADESDLLAAVKHYAEACEGVERQFIKHGKTFLGKTNDWREWKDGIPDGVTGRVGPKRSVGGIPVEADA